MSGTCFGYEVRSDVPLAYLRGGAGEPLEIRAPAPEGEAPEDVLLIEWRAAPERPLEAKLWSSGRRFRLWIGDGGWFAVDPDEPRIDVPADGGIRCEERLWGIPSLLCFLARGDLPLHAAAVEVEGGAVIVAAPRTYGKTTMAAAFHRAGYRVLGEDTACVRLGPDAAVIPGPAMLRLRHDVARLLELPGARLVGEDPDRIHYSLEPAGDCEPVPLRAVVLLGEGDAAVLEPVEPPEALRDLWALSFRLPTEQDVGRSFAAVADLAAAVPVLRLRRPLVLDALAEHVALVAAGV
jgi:hypothetical protein